MIKISVRELSHNLAKYIKKAEKGEKIVIMKRNKPIVQMQFYKDYAAIPSWKEPFEPIKIKGEPLSETIIKMREDRF